MPIIPQGPESRTPSGNRSPYRKSLINRSHQILKMGYDGLDHSSFANCEEEEITGRLSQAMQDSLEKVNAPLWSKNFSVHEEVPVNDDEREGKRRLRIDIEVMQHQYGPRPRFRFEAKRLKNADSRNRYLGHNGLGRFLDGRYASTDPDAGMLGYVQEATVQQHALALGELLSASNESYAVVPNQGWTDNAVITGLDSFRTLHNRRNGLPQIMILHTLLTFC